MRCLDRLAAAGHQRNTTELVGLHAVTKHTILIPWAASIAVTKAASIQIGMLLEITYIVCRPAGRHTFLIYGHGSALTMQDRYARNFSFPAEILTLFVVRT